MGEAKRKKEAQMLNYDSEAIAKRIGISVVNLILYVTLFAWGGLFVMVILAMDFWETRRSNGAKFWATVTGKRWLFD